MTRAHRLGQGALSITISALVLFAPLGAAHAEDPPEPGGYRTTSPPEPGEYQPLPPVASPPITPPAVESTVEAPRPKIVPWIVLAGSVAAAVAGAVLAVRTADAIAEPIPGLSQAALTSLSGVEEQIRDREREMLVDGLLASLLLSAATAGLVTSTALLTSD